MLHEHGLDEAPFLLRANHFVQGKATEFQTKGGSGT